MLDPLLLAPAFAAGLVLGVTFYGGLWWTVRRGIAATQPALWFLGGLLLRMGIALSGFYLVGGDEWPRWLICLAGFVIARFIVQRATPGRQISLRREAGHAS